MRKSLVLVSLLLISALALTACGGGSSAGPTTKLKVTLADNNTFNPKALEAAVGTVEVTLENTGVLVHDFVITSLKVKETVEPKKTKVATFKVDKAGTYEIICTQAGHADAGMKGTLVVK